MQLVELELLKKHAETTNCEAPQSSARLKVFQDSWMQTGEDIWDKALQDPRDLFT